jgi:flagellar FliJ protein
MNRQRRTVHLPQGTMMQRFRFRLESILDIKKRVEEEIKKELSRKNGEIVAARRRHDEIIATLDRLLTEEKHQRNSIINLLAVRMSLSYHLQLKKDAGNALSAIENLERERETIRVRLTTARKETRVLEILREKKYAQWLKEFRTEEQKFADDVSQKGYIRKMQTAVRTGT